MQLRASPHCGREYKEKVRAKKKLIDVPELSSCLLVNYNEIRTTIILWYVFILVLLTVSIHIVFFD